MSCLVDTQVTHEQERSNLLRMRQLQVETLARELVEMLRRARRCNQSFHLKRLVLRGNGLATHERQRVQEAADEMSEMCPGPELIFA